MSKVFVDVGISLHVTEVIYLLLVTHMFYNVKNPG
jgi:hypothetical protein